MKDITKVKGENPQKTFSKRMRGVFWTSSLFVSFVTFFAPILTESSERYSMAGEMAVKGYEMVAYTPLLSTFVITAPILNAMLHTTELPGKKKIFLYYALGIVYGITFGASLILTAVRILNTENHIVTFSGGVYLVVTLYLLSLSVGALPTMWMMDDDEDEDDEL